QYLGRDRRRSSCALASILNHHHKHDLRIIEGREPDKPRIGRASRLITLVALLVHIINDRLSLAIVDVNIAVGSAGLARCLDLSSKRRERAGGGSALDHRTHKRSKVRRRLSRDERADYFSRRANLEGRSDKHTVRACSSRGDQTHRHHRKVVVTLPEALKRQVETRDLAREV